MVDKQLRCYGRDGFPKQVMKWYPTEIKKNKGRPKTTGWMRLESWEKWNLRKRIVI